MKSLYTRFVAAESPDGAIGAIADLLVDGTLSRDTFDAVVHAHGVAESREFRDGLLDLMLLSLRAAVHDHCITADEMTFVRHLAVTFRVQEGELYDRRKREVAEILKAEMYRMLEDQRIDSLELAYQDALQRLFGLGYDQFVELIRDAVTPLVDRMIARATADGVVTDDERAEIDRQLSALRTVYVLSATQRRALGMR